MEFLLKKKSSKKESSYGMPTDLENEKKKIYWLIGFHEFINSLIFLKLTIVTILKFLSASLFITIQAVGCMDFFMINIITIV